MLSWLPLAFSGLLCPLMMGALVFFMMRGRNSNSNRASDGPMEGRLAKLEREKAELEARVTDVQKTKRGS